MHARAPGVLNLIRLGSTTTGVEALKRNVRAVPHWGYLCESESHRNWHHGSIRIPMNETKELASWDFKFGEFTQIKWMKSTKGIQIWRDKCLGVNRFLSVNKCFHVRF